MRQRVVRRSDAGQVATALLVVAVLGAVALLVMVVLPLTGAADQRSRAQTAADAAALAHVDHLARRIEEGLTNPAGLPYGQGRLGRLVDCDAGRAAADDFARRNGAEVTADDLSGCGALARTTVTVDVRMVDPLPSGQRSGARARAQIGFPTGRCELNPDPTGVLAAFTAANAVAAAAEQAAAAAEQAAADAAAALSDAVNATPEQAAVLQAAFEDARQVAQDALDAAQDAADAVPGADIAITGDCGPVELELALRLPAAKLEFRGVRGGDLDDLVEPRLVSTRASQL